MAKSPAPWAAKALRYKVSFHPILGFMVQNKQIHRRRRYAAWYFEVDTRGFRYLLPMACFAWYYHHEVWPSMAVRTGDGGPFDLTAENLRLSTNHPTPKVIPVGRLKHG